MNWLKIGKQADRVSPYVLIATGTFTAALSLATGWMFLRALQLFVGVAMVGMASYVVAARQTREVIVGFGESLKELLAAATLEQDLTGTCVLTHDDDGHLHALVTLATGDVKLVDIPDENAETPADAARYLARLFSAEGWGDEE